LYWGVQGVLYPAKAAKPTLAVSFFHHAYDDAQRTSTSEAQRTYLHFWPAPISRNFILTGTMFFTELVQIPSDEASLAKRFRFRIR